MAAVRHSLPSSDEDFPFARGTAHGTAVLHSYHSLPEAAQPLG